MRVSNEQFSQNSNIVNTDKMLISKFGKNIKYGLITNRVFFLLNIKINGKNIYINL